MSAFGGEFLGTMILVLLGDGVVANALLKGTKGQGSNFQTINIAWGAAVFIAVAMVAPVSGAHINPAVTLGLALSGKFAWQLVPSYFVAQFLGAGVGAVVVWLFYRQHFAVEESADSKLAVFCTAPAIRGALDNVFSEVVGTGVLVLGVLMMAAPETGLGALSAMPVGILVLVIGMSLGGTTGYAINPARDLAPRLVHALVPIPGKRDSDWGYAWIPVVGPAVGGAVAALVYGGLAYL